MQKKKKKISLLPQTFCNRVCTWNDYKFLVMFFQLWSLQVHDHHHSQKTFTSRCCDWQQDLLFFPLLVRHSFLVLNRIRILWILLGWCNYSLNLVVWPFISLTNVMLKFLVIILRSLEYNSTLFKLRTLKSWWKFLPVYTDNALWVWIIFPQDSNNNSNLVRWSFYFSKGKFFIWPHKCC